MAQKWTWVTKSRFNQSSSFLIWSKTFFFWPLMLFNAMYLNTFFNVFFFPSATLLIAMFPLKPILMFSLVLHVQFSGGKKNLFPSGSKFSHWGTKCVPKFKHHPGQCEGWGEQEEDPRWIRAMLASVWEKSAGWVTRHGKKKSLRKYSTNRRRSRQKVSHL